MPSKFGGIPVETRGSRFGGVPVEQEMVDTDFGPRPANEVVDVVSRPAPKPAKPSLFRMDSDFRNEAGLGMSDMLVASAKDMFGSRKGAADYLAQQYNKKHGLSTQINGGARVVNGDNGDPMIRLPDGSMYRTNDPGLDSTDVGNVAGNVGAFFLPASWAGRYAQARNMGLLGRMGVQGAAAGATDTALQAGTQGGKVDLGRTALVAAGGAGGELAGAALRAGGRGVVAGYRGARNAITAPTVSGAEREAARTILSFVDDPAALMTPRPSATSGAKRTLFEETMLEPIARLETRSRGTSSGWKEFDAANDGARQAAIRKFAGDESTLDAAIGARSKAVDPLYAAANKTEGVDTSRLLSQIKRLEKAQEGRPAVQRGLSDVRNLLTREVPEAERKKTALAALNAFATSGRKSAADFESAKVAMSAIRRGEVPQAQFTSKSGKDALKAAQKAMKTETMPQDKMRVIANARLTINDMLGGKYGGDSGQAMAGSRALMAVKNQLDRVAAKGSPEFAQATQTFRTMSQPINRMQAGQKLLQQATSRNLDPISGQYPLVSGQYGGKVKALDKLVQDATGFRKAQASNVFRPEDMQTIHSVQDDLSRSAARLPYGNGGGSHTMSQGEVAVKMAGKMLIRKLPWLGSAVEALDAAAQQRVEGALASMLQNPEQFRRVAAALPAHELALVNRAASELGLSRLPAAAGGLIMSQQQRGD